MVSTREKVRSDGSVAYIARFRHNGRQTSETFDTARGRDRFVRNVNTLGLDAALDLLDDSASTKETMPTLGEWAERCIGLLSGVSEATPRRYRAYMRNDFADLAPIPLDSISDEVITRWIQRAEKAGASPKTIANKHGFLSGILAQAVGRHLEANPCTKSARGLPAVHDAEMVFLDADDIATLLQYIPGHYRPLVTMLLATGLRWSEATALTVGDIDVRRRVVKVTKAWKKRDGAGWYIGPPKSRKGTREVPLARQLLGELEPLLDRPADARLFTTPSGTDVRHAVFYQYIWKPAVRLANGLPAADPDSKDRRRVSALFKGVKPAGPEARMGKRPRPHDCRHTAASWWLASGIDLLTVQRTMGHESLQTTADRYGHLLPSRVAEASAAMSSLLAQALPDVEDAAPEIEAGES